ncbi:hypothetical protein [Parvicella tangerina]|uniref:DUF3575 domain-containing protein n=1 Tax=Parvicella tangerina TaxID=2829795 RepID=A0A916JLY2_9FLAO|nr:hypothetical protein [Parvicella tangerina]CAG5080120.1 hypothetical protein CRYO30217_01190 [Parvicella tangerina]
MRICLFSFLVLISAFFCAQEGKKVSIETQFRLLSDTGASQNNLKIRYHFNEKHVLRTNWSFMYNSATNEILETDGDGVGSIEEVTAAHYVSLGYERHFAFDKMAPYLGGALGYGFGNESEYGSRTDGLTFINDFNYNQQQKISAIYVDVFSGFDFNLYKGLYLGTEIGLRFLNTKYLRGELQTEDASSTTDSSTTTPIPEKKSTSLSLVNMGVLRVGWKF